MSSSSCAPNDRRDSDRWLVAPEVMPRATLQVHFSQTVLVVDDDEDACDLTAVVLQRAGYHVATAANGEEALTYLRRYPAPCLILLDLAMPVMDGWEFLDEREKNPTFKAIPVIIASGERGVTNRAAAAGVEFLPKPLQRASLLNALQSVLERTVGQR
jgi:CheY-like chemotaxis protein